MARIGKWCAVLLVVSSAAFAAEDRFQREYTKDFPFRGGKVSVEHSFGGVRIDTDSGSEVHVRATIRASDPDFGKQIRVIAEPVSSGLSIRTEYPAKMFRHGGNSSYSVDYRITVPRNAQLDVKNQFGSIEASGFGEPSGFINSYGSIRLHDAKGSQHVEGAFGSIEIHDVDGVANVSNKYGSIRAHDVNGDLALSNAFGSLNVENVHGNVDVAGQNGSVMVRHVDGTVKVSNSFASITVGDVKRDADIRNRNGRIELSEVGGNAVVNTSYGSVQLDDVGGNATVRTSFGSIFGRNLRGAIDVVNQNGAIAVSQVGSSCRPITLRTSFSSIRVSVPPNAGYTVNARTSYGRISSALPVTTRTMSEDTLVGTIGSGACRMELVNANGSITIEKE